MRKASAIISLNSKHATCNYKLGLTIMMIAVTDLEESQRKHNIHFIYITFSQWMKQTNVHLQEIPITDKIW